jgi:bis(5'-nucleosidyl)-tetraphosphatase
MNENLIEDESYGIIPLMQEGKQWKVFLILHKEGNHWGFPKGHRQGHETQLEAATRELKEETGLDIVRVLDEAPLTEQYRFRRSGQNIVKKVFYFPAMVTGTFQLQLEEIREGRWFTFEEAIKQLTFKEGRSICAHLMKILKVL